MIEFEIDIEISFRAFCVSLFYTPCFRRRLTSAMGFKNHDAGFYIIYSECLSVNMMVNFLSGKKQNADNMY